MNTHAKQLLSKLGRDAPKPTLQGFHKAWVWVDHISVGWLLHYLSDISPGGLESLSRNQHKTQSIQPSSITTIFCNCKCTNLSPRILSNLSPFHPSNRHPIPVPILRFVVGREGWSKPLGTFGTHWRLQWATVFVGWSFVVCLGWKTSPPKGRSSLCI